MIKKKFVRNEKSTIKIVLSNCELCHHHHYFFRDRILAKKKKKDFKFFQLISYRIFIFFLSFPFWVIGLPEKKHINVNVCVWALSLWWNYQRRRRRRQLRQKSEKNVNWARKKNRKKSIDSSMKKKKKLLSLSFVYWVYEFCQIINSTHSSVFFFLGYSDKQIFIFFFDATILDKFVLFDFFSVLVRFFYFSRILFVTGRFSIF